MAYEIKYARPNGAFVIVHPVTGFDYEVVEGDPLYAEVAAEAEGRDIPAQPAPPPLDVPRQVTPLEFMDRIGGASQLAIAEAALSSGPVLLWLLRLTAARYIDLDSDETISGVASLRAADLITDEEVTALLA